MSWFARLFGKCQKHWKEPVTVDAAPETVKAAPKAPYLTQTVVFGMHRYRRAGDDSTVLFVDEARGIRKMLVDSEGRFQDFPGIVEEDFWVKYVEPRDLQPQIRFRTSFEDREDRWIILWQICPDGRYWADEDGFGMTNDEETHLYTFVDMEGNYTGPFRIYDMGMREFYKPERQRYPVSRATRLPASFPDLLEKWRQELEQVLINGVLDQCSGSTGVTFVWRGVHYAMEMEDLCSGAILKEYGSDVCHRAFASLLNTVQADLKDIGAKDICAD